MYACPHFQQNAVLHLLQDMCTHPPSFSIGVLQRGQGFVLTTSSEASSTVTRCCRPAEREWKDYILLSVWV